MKNINTKRDIELINILLNNKEGECLEFKRNNTDPKVIGKLCSALSNAARIYNKDYAYILFGIDDNGKIIGTNFRPNGKETLKFKLSQTLNPSIDCYFKVINHPDGNIVMLQIPAASTIPVVFNNIAYIRIGSATPKLSDHPDKMTILLKRLQTYTWETDIAKQFLTANDVLSFLDYKLYFKLTNKPLPQNINTILKYLETDNIIKKDISDKWNILNLGALLLAKTLTDFDTLSRKELRFVVYAGDNKATAVIHRKDENQGYAIAIKNMVSYIDNLLPKTEVIGKVYRETKIIFPEIAMREIITNALMHQDMTIKGTGPTIELFTNRLEIINPGKSLNPADRIIDLPSKSRNEKLSNLMRKMHLCEEQGSGIDKIIYSVEKSMLPAPEFRLHDEFTQVILYAYKSFANLTTEERERACYQHAVIKYIKGEKLKNSSLCIRFGIKKGNESQVSKVIKKALSKKLIKIADIKSPRSGYYPGWV